jgi:hypothetical protein
MPGQKRKEGAKKGESEREKGNKEEIQGSSKRCPSLLVEPWQSRTELLPPLHWAICKNS